VTGVSYQNLDWFDINIRPQPCLVVGVCLFYIYLPVCLLLCLPIPPSIPSLSPFLHLSIYSSLCLCVLVSWFLFLCLHPLLSLYPCLCIYVSVCFTMPLCPCSSFSICVCLCVYVCLCLIVYIFLSVSTPLNLSGSISYSFIIWSKYTSVSLCLGFSLSLSLHVSVSQFLSASQWLSVPVAILPSVHLCGYMTLCLYLSLSLYSSQSLWLHDLFTHQMIKYASPLLMLRTKADQWWRIQAGLTPDEVWCKGWPTLQWCWTGTCHVLRQS